MKHMLTKVGWRPDFVEKSVPIIPISGWMGDNLTSPSTNMGWWKGQDIEINNKKVHVHTLLDALNDMVELPGALRALWLLASLGRGRCVCQLFEDQVFCVAFSHAKWDPT
jgi:hypothetical protein